VAYPTAHHTSPHLTHPPPPPPPPLHATELHIKSCMCDAYLGYSLGSQPDTRFGAQKVQASGFRSMTLQYRPTHPAEEEPK
jgi:hypothetical protein